MFKYGKMQRKIPSWLVYDSCGTCLDHTLYGIQAGWDVFLYSNHLVCEDNDSLLYRHHAGPWWDSETEKMKIFSCITKIHKNIVLQKFGAIWYILCAQILWMDHGCSCT